MNEKKEKLQKLIKFVYELSKQEDNEWFREELASKLDERIKSKSQMDEIYEYCIRLIIQEQALQFYQNFKLSKIKDGLVNDFMRMEKFRREDNFDDFCLAIHQQFEAIVNCLCESNSKFIESISIDKEKIAYRIKDADFKLWQLILTNYKTQSDADQLFKKPIVQWDYSFKLKAVIYFFIFDQKIFGTYQFNDYYNSINDIYQSRNLNHRGGFQTDRQKSVTLRILEEKYRYYFKFLGILENFVTKINSTF